MLESSISSLSAIVCVLVLLLPTLFILYEIYSLFYFNGKKFKAIKDEISNYTIECNEINEHIEDMKKTYINIKSIDYGNSYYVDTSRYNFKRPEWHKIYLNQNVHQCSLSVVKNAKDQPFKYICKYFNIKSNEEDLEQFENVLNQFSAVEQGKLLLNQRKKNIIDSISNKIPFLIKTFSHKKVEKKLGFIPIDFSEYYFPTYTFQYVSAGGNSSMRCDIRFDLNNLERFVGFLAEKVKFKKSVAGQRALMTRQLREKIKRRDNFTCQQCGVSTKDEPTLLLEIDHIIPLSKGGITSEDNLQTLCWKCNRSKGAKYSYEKLR